jgi:hypothetical protein
MQYHNRGASVRGQGCDRKLVGVREYSALTRFAEPACAGLGSSASVPWVSSVLPGWSVTALRRSLSGSGRSMCCIPSAFCNVHMRVVRSSEFCSVGGDVRGFPRQTVQGL